MDEDIEDYKRVEDSLETVGRRLTREPIEFETRLLVRGFKPGEDIVTFAKENEVDQIVIGIKRKSKVGKMLFGSNAQYVILNAHCPVLTT